MVENHSTYDDALGQVLVDGPHELAATLALTDYEPLFARLQQYNCTGRPPYDVRAMWRAFQAKYLLGIRYNVELVALLRSNRAVADACGFDATTPNESIVCRFFKRLTNHQGLVDEALTALRDRLVDAVNERKGAHEPAVGQVVAIDSTDIETFVNTRVQPYSDPTARWGIRTAKIKTKEPLKGKEYFFGYKMHSLCDAYYGIPLGHIILPANANDSPQLPKVFDQVRVAHPRLPMRYALADRGYDAGTNYRYLEDHGIAPVIFMRNTDKNGIYTVRGKPKCVGGKAMDFIGTDEEKGHQFRCPEGGCRLKDKIGFTRYCDDEFYELPELGDTGMLRSVGRALARASKRWRGLYRKRYTVERLFNSLKQSRLLTLHRYRRQVKVELHSALSNLTYLATMLWRAEADDMENLRIMRLRPPNAAGGSVQK